MVGAVSGFRCLALLLLSMLGAGPCHGEDIAAVLQRSQAQRLSSFESVPADMPAARLLQRDFEVLLAVNPPRKTPQLRVVVTGTSAETVLGEVVVVNVAMAEWPEVARRFVLAHELGHIRDDHWADRVRLYQSFIAGDVNPAATDAVSGPLGAAASQQSYRHEHDADELAMNLLLDLGYTEDDLFQLMVRFGNHRATPTHPSMTQRIAHLRAVVEARSFAGATLVVSPPSAGTTPAGPQDGPIRGGPDRAPPSVRDPVPGRCTDCLPVRADAVEI